ncbi:MAG: DNA translocase FtsK 4TM domain-containing protein, partial [Pseudomonadota bacterium]
MAYQSHRDPLFDTKTQAVIEQRGREMLGLAVVVIGLILSIAILTYTPSDPSFLASSDEPVGNWLGGFGAAVAAPLMIIIGTAAWFLPLLFLVWGARLFLHQGSERAIGRLIFAPIAVAVAAIYAATTLPGEVWTHSFGLGGLFGDTVLIVILQLVPGSAAAGARFISFIAGAGMVALGLFVLGFTRRELVRAVRYVVAGLILTYDALMTMLGQGAQLGARAATRRLAVEDPHVS